MSASEPGGYGRGAAVLSVGIGITGLVTYAYFSLSSHALPEDEYGHITLLWSAVFVVVSVLYRPVEQLLSRTIADRDARGHGGSDHLRVAGTIQLGLAALFALAALGSRDLLEDELFGGSSTLYWILVATVLAYAGSYFARGFLAGHRRFGLYGGLVLLESTSRCSFALAVAVGLTEGESAIALGMVAAPIVSLAVVPLAVTRTAARAGGREGNSPETRADGRGEAFRSREWTSDPKGRAGGQDPPATASEKGRAGGQDPPAAASEKGRAGGQDPPGTASGKGPPAATSGAPPFTLKHGSGFAAAVLLIMLAEQTLLNAGPLVVNATEDEAGAALAGFTFNVLLIARAPLQLFQAVQASILPHLTEMRATGAAAPFRRSVNVTLAAIGAFSTAAAAVMLAIGPWLMDLFFGGEFDYGRGGLALVAAGMGLYLAAATLNQAALAQARAKQAAGCWLAAAAGFVGFLLVPGWENRVEQVEVGYAASALVLFALLSALYRRPEPTAGATVGAEP